MYRVTSKFMSISVLTEYSKHGLSTPAKYARCSKFSDTQNGLPVNLASQVCLDSNLKNVELLYLYMCEDFFEV